MAETENTVVQPGQLIRPHLDLDLCKKLVKRLYGLTVVNGSELNSYDDRNFHVEVSEDVINKHILKPNPDGYVLKILNSLDSKHEDFVEAQTMMILHLVDRGVRTPGPVRNKDGHFMSLETIPVNQNENGNNTIHCVVRLFEYLPGTILKGIPFTSQLMFQVGQITGQVDHTLTTFHHPAHDKHRRIWCLSELSKVAAFAYCITDVNQHSIVDDVISTFEREVMGNFECLTKGTIHGDVNETNILVQTAEDSNTVSVAGILDFGDSVNSCYVFEVAIMICYIIINSDESERINNAGYALAGYLSKFQLNSKDLRVLKECICGRFVTSLVMGKYSVHQDPDNAEYLLSTQRNGWECLTQLWTMPNDELFGIWRQCIECYGIEWEL